MTEGIDRQQAAVDDLTGLLRHERRGDAWVGRTPDGDGPVVFGGVGLALTISAACADAPAGARLHSTHAHFLRPVRGGHEIAFRTDVVKAGRTFSLHRVTASQDAKPVITMVCSFTERVAVLAAGSGARAPGTAARTSKPGSGREIPGLDTGSRGQNAEDGSIIRSG